ncbi:MAG: hypothetical protein GWN73_15575, partial [Actinobacteria bacterium]|nr:hypothetical protein [Actinomycetota bacterium]NIW28560.1 hypothetical protein [Actinomycetota bacterium]
YGVKAADVEAVVRLRHCLLAENLPDEDLEGGTGVEATSGGRLEVS